jgi:hypothetical protein
MMRREGLARMPVAAGLWAVVASGAPRAQEGGSIKLAPYYPTPETIAGRMLRLGGLKAGEKMFDPGSGDGRIAIMAAQKFHAEAAGSEIDPELCRQSLAKSARIVHGDLRAQNYSSADLVTVYLPPDAIDDKVQPPLDRQLQKGARVLAQDLAFRGWTAEKVENVADDGEGRSRTLSLNRK